MTILPKKKQSSSKSGEVVVDKGDNHQGSSHLNRYNNYGHHSHTHSPPRWSTSRSDEKRTATDSDHLNEPPSTKRRLREHRSHRKTKTVNIVGSDIADLNNQDATTSVSTTGAQSDKNDDAINRSESPSGYNSGDEYDRPPELWTQSEAEERESYFERKVRKKGYIIKTMGEDGACLFRAVADQIYGDQEMHETVRCLCMDYMAKNSDYFSQYVTEDFEAYIQRKRKNHIHGNHIEMQAMSEIFNRPIEVYHYSSEPINIFNGCQQTDNEPIRLSYHRGVHYNSIVDPYKATIGVGLGLPAMKPGLAEKTLMDKAVRISEEHELEQAMLEDKIKATDWEATNEAIEEQIARESYVEWLKENEMRSYKKNGKSASATVTNDGSKSPQEIKSPKTNSPRSSPQASSSGHVCSNSAAKSEFSLVETASFMHQVPPSVFGLSDYEEGDILAKVLAQSQQEYLDFLKRDSKTNNMNNNNSNSNNSNSMSGSKTSTPSSSSATPQT